MALRPSRKRTKLTHTFSQGLTFSPFLFPLEESVCVCLNHSVFLSLTIPSLEVESVMTRRIVHFLDIHLLLKKTVLMVIVNQNLHNQIL